MKSLTPEKQAAMREHIREFVRVSKERRDAVASGRAPCGDCRGSGYTPDGTGYCAGCRGVGLR